MASSTQYDQIIQDTLFKPASFDAQELQKVFLNYLDPHIDFADIYLQNTLNESWILEDSQVKRGHFQLIAALAFA